MGTEGLSNIPSVPISLEALKAEPENESCFRQLVTAFDDLSLSKALF
jgi:hypothetical protein